MSTHYYVTPEGVFLGGFGRPTMPPEGSIEIFDLPEVGDQIYLFPGWGPSPAVTRRVENEWRDAEMAVAELNVTAIQFGDPDALPGTESAWKAYWVALKNWTEGKGGYPDITRRPKRPA